MDNGGHFFAQFSVNSDSVGSFYRASGSVTDKNYIQLSILNLYNTESAKPTDFICNFYGGANMENGNQRPLLCPVQCEL